MDSVKIKICGIKDVDTALFCADSGVDYIGINFSPASVRKTDLNTAEKILNAFVLRDIHETKAVFLFYKNPLTEIKSLLQTITPDYIQYITDDLKESDLQFTNISLIPAIRVRTKISNTDLEQFHSNLFILDSYSEQAGGGTGQSFNWENIKGITKKFLLAGGLNPDNVQQAVASIQPFGVDVASGVESSPGIKDQTMIRKFIENAKRR